MDCNRGVRWSVSVDDHDRLRRITRAIVGDAATRSIAMSDTRRSTRTPADDRAAPVAGAARQP
jgi:hypothetical protein